MSTSMCVLTGIPGKLEKLKGAEIFVRSFRVQTTTVS